VHLAGPGLADHAHDLARGGAAHDGVVDQHHALAFQHRAVGAVLHAHAELAHALGRLDEGAARIVAADDAQIEGHAAGLGVAQGGRHAAVGHRHHDVGLDAGLLGQAPAHALAHVIDRAAVHDAVGAGEVDVFEDARPGLLGRERAQRFDAALRDDDHLAVVDVADECGADHVERAGLRRQDVGAVELAEHQRADAQRVAHADQLLVGQGDQGVAALDLGHRVDEAVDHLGLPRAGDQVKDHLAVRGRLEDGPVGDQFLPQEQEVGQVAVVADGDAAGLEVGEHRLDVADAAAAGGGVAGVADGVGAGQAAHGVGAAEGFADLAHVALGVEALAVEGGDAAGLLAAMLQGVQAKATTPAASGRPKTPQTPHSRRSWSSSGWRCGGAFMCGVRGERTHGVFCTSSSTLPRRFSLSRLPSLTALPAARVTAPAN
jgi:hypothetical protein